MTTSLVSAVTNANREQFLKAAVAHELVRSVFGFCSLVVFNCFFKKNLTRTRFAQIDSRKPAFDAIRKGLFALTGIKVMHFCLCVCLLF